MSIDDLAGARQKALPDGGWVSERKSRPTAKRWGTGVLAGLGLFLTIASAQAQTYYSEQRFAAIPSNSLSTPPVRAETAVKGRRTRRGPAQKSRGQQSPPALGQFGGLPQEPMALQSVSVHIQQGQQPCWDAAARYQNVRGLNPWLLYAVAYVESRHNPNAVGRNTNGSYDLGLMQINSTWFPTLKRYGIQPKLLTNACASTFVGAWVLAQTIHRYGFTWQAIAAYNVGSVDTPRRRAIGYAYAKRVYAAYDLLTRRAGLTATASGGLLHVDKSADYPVLHHSPFSKELSDPSVADLAWAHPGPSGRHKGTTTNATTNATKLGAPQLVASVQIPGVTKPAADSGTSKH